MSSKILKTEGTEVYEQRQRRVTQETPINNHYQMMNQNQNLYSSEVFNQNKTPVPSYYNTNHRAPMPNTNTNLYAQNNQRVNTHNPPQQTRNNTNLFDLHLKTLNRQNQEEQMHSVRMKQNDLRHNHLRNSRSSNINKAPYSMKDTLYHNQPPIHGNHGQFNSNNRKNQPLSNNSIRVFNNNKMYGSNRYMSPKNAPVSQSYNQRKMTGFPPHNRKNPPARPPTNRFAKKGSPNTKRGGQKRGYKIF